MRQQPLTSVRRIYYAPRTFHAARCALHFVRSAWYLSDLIFFTFEKLSIKKSFRAFWLLFHFISTPNASIFIFGGGLQSISVCRGKVMNNTAHIYACTHIPIRISFSLFFCVRWRCRVFDAFYLSVYCHCCRMIQKQKKTYIHCVCNECFPCFNIHIERERTTLGESVRTASKRVWKKIQRIFVKN